MRAKKMKHILISRLNGSHPQNIAYYHNAPKHKHHHRSNQYLMVAVTSFFMAVIIFIIGWIAIENLSTPRSFSSGSGIYVDLKDIAPLLLEESRR